jgi:alpha-L-fucosidase 2
MSSFLIKSESYLRLKKATILFFIVVLTILTACEKGRSKSFNSLKLWYRQPAGTWEQAIPVGNGRLGAMVFGDPVNEHLQINEESIWAGSRVNNNNPKALKHLPELREAIFNSKYKKAYDLAEKYLLGTPPNIRSYQPFGDMLIYFLWSSEPVAYKRQLDLETGVASSSFSVDGKHFIEEVFASAPDNLIVVHIKSSDGGTINATYSLAREKDASVSAINNHILRLSGRIIDSDDPGSGPGGDHMSFSGELRLFITGGQIDSASNKLEVRGANEITAQFTATTDYNIDSLNFDRSIDPVAESMIILDKTESVPYSELLRRHLEEYKPMFGRVSLTLGDDSLSVLPADERLARIKSGGKDNGFEALYFQYGRYLLMCSSRPPGRLPANLQGIWNKDMKAPWNSDFHTNINLQMNYWPAEVCNLPETSIILSSFMEKLMVPGRVTAKEMYGAEGWTLHHLTDPFGRTGVADGVWGITPMDGPWMTCSLNEHYLFTQDTAYLRDTAYPLMKGAAEFILGYLVKSPEGYLVTNPSHSPENNFRDTSNGEVSALTYAATTDIEIVREVFDNCIKATKILDVDNDFAGELEDAEMLLPPVRINSKGVIQEWIRDFEETEPGHRHMSHLLGLYPFSQFTPETPYLYQAAGRTIERRLSFGGGHTGWSRAWIINLFARLHNGEKAYQNLLELLRKSTLENLFDSHPPFQIDGNFGGAAGIAEMLIQSQNGIIRLLPALPKEWERGEVKGICARGGFIIDMKWMNGKIKNAKVYSKYGGKCSIYYNGIEQHISLNPGQKVVLKD